MGSRYRRASEEALDLLASMLTFDPAKRITIDEALDHPYFGDVSRSVRFKVRLYPLIIFSFVCMVSCDVV